MPLVNDKVMHRLKDKNGFIYKNFAYIFQNPLWNAAEVPKGFWICPYYWMSLLVGFFFMRLFFVPTLLGIGKVAQVFPLLNGLYNKLILMGMKKCKVDQDTIVKTEKKPLSGLMISAVVLFVLALLLVILYGLYNLLFVTIPHLFMKLVAFVPIYLQNIGSGHRGYISVTYAISLFIVFCVCKIVNENKSNSKCRPYVYFKLGLFATFMHAIYMFREELWITITGIWRFITVFFSCAWECITVDAWGWLTSAFHTTCSGIYSAATFSPFWGLPMWAVIIIFWALVYLIGTIAPKLITQYLDYSDKKREAADKKYMAKLKTQPVKAEDWHALFARERVIFPGHQMGFIFSLAQCRVSEFYNTKDLETKALTLWEKTLSNGLALEMMSKFFKIPQELLNREEWEKTNRKLNHLRSDKVTERPYRPYVEDLFEDPDMISEIKKLFSEFVTIYSVGITSGNAKEHPDGKKAKACVKKYIRSKHKKIIPTLLEKKKEEAQKKVQKTEKQKAKEESTKRREEMCAKLTTALSDTGLLLLKIAVFPIVFPVKIAWKVTKTVTFVTWTFIKMRKQAMCPYVTFHDGEEYKEVKQENNLKGDANAV